MDVSRAVAYVREDPKWLTKVLILGVLFFPGAFLIVPSFIASGYLLQVVRNIRAGQESPLPEWDQIGAYLVDGLKFFVVVLVYLIPAIVVSLIPFIGAIIALVYELALLLALPVIYSAYLDGGNSIGSGLQFKAVLERVQANVSPLMMPAVIGLVAGIVGQLGIIACCVGIIFTMPYAMLSYSHVIAKTIDALPAAPASPTEPTAEA